jgi:Domain of unknown function (DUF1844)
MTGLWTPYGEHQPEPDRPDQPGTSGGPPLVGGPGGGPDLSPDLSPEEAAAAREQLRELREQLANTPVADIIANHVIGLWELAVLHLTTGAPSQAPAPAGGEAAASAAPDEGRTPDLEEARLAIDAIGAIVEGLGARLGDNAEPLRDALAQLRLAFVERSRAGEQDH